MLFNRIFVPGEKFQTLKTRHSHAIYTLKKKTPVSCIRGHNGVLVGVDPCIYDPKMRRYC